MVAMSYNGNTFMANQDIMKTFNIKVLFSPAYHQQANGAVERQHQNLKKSLRLLSSSWVKFTRTSG
jgi:hypothetical protein